MKQPNYVAYWRPGPHHGWQKIAHGDTEGSALLAAAEVMPGSGWLAILAYPQKPWAWDGPGALPVKKVTLLDAEASNAN